MLSALLAALVRSYRSQTGSVGTWNQKPLLSRWAQRCIGLPVPPPLMLALLE